MQKNYGLPVIFSGVVAKGRGLGRGLGYATANLVSQSGDQPDIPYGVYAGWANVAGNRFMSIMSFGKAETMGTTNVSFEAHLLDYEGDVYGKELRVEIAVFLRSMKKFNSVELLKDAMKEDERQAREFFGKQETLCTQALFITKQK